MGLIGFLAKGAGVGRMEHGFYVRGWLLPQVITLDEPVGARFVPFVLPVPACNHGYSLYVLIWSVVQFGLVGFVGGFWFAVGFRLFTQPM